MKMSLGDPTGQASLLGKSAWGALENALGQLSLQGTQSEDWQALLATDSVNEGVKRMREDLEKHGVKCAAEGKVLQQSVHILSNEVSTEGRAFRKSLQVLRAEFHAEGQAGQQAPVVLKRLQPHLKELASRPSSSTRWTQLGTEVLM